MWADAAATMLSCRLWSPITATSNQGRRTALPFVVSARYIRRSRPRKNINYVSDEEERDNFRELDTMRKQEIGGSDEAQVIYASAPNSMGPEEQAKISGSAVLLALQKASAQKTFKKIKKKSKNMKGEDKPRRQRDDEAASAADYSYVKPLCIKSDWKDRLDELETQLHQLIHNT